MDITTLYWRDNTLFLIDQRVLPARVEYVAVHTADETHDAIRNMTVRGAPAIGVAAAYGAILAAIESARDADFYRAFSARCEHIAAARPTAVNLVWAVERMKKIAAERASEPVPDIIAALEREAVAIHKEDVAINRAIGENLLSLMSPGFGVLTHCNAGALATSEYGTALSVFYLAKERGFPLRAFADETRPRLQGARLTSFELFNAGIDVTLISDNMAAVLMRDGKLDACVVGCDRVAANGDAANKIGTFGLSIVAKHFGIPFYIAAPTPTIDLSCPTGGDIPIEERDGDEIRKINGEYVCPPDVKVFNPSFDVTPAENIAAIVTEKGIFKPSELRKAFD